MDPHHIVKRVIRTEKSVNDTTDNNKYHFEVAAGATKYQIKEAVQALFPDVTVVGINTVTARGKRRRHRYTFGKRRDWKKAVVTIQEGQTINVGY
jgi:large subunit ribosomal protein L23